MILKMQFGPSQKSRFDTNDGTYSVVTETEFGDSQITATDVESTLLESFFNKANIHRGKVRDNIEKAQKTFKLFPSGEEVNLNLVYPKKNKQELRLYLSIRAGFKPSSGDIWFMYLKDNAIWIGSEADSIWRDSSRILIYDEYEGEYQNSIQELEHIKTHKSSRDVYSRDRNKALERLNLANYQCENKCSRKLFVSRSTGKPYLEAHHLIPMAAQSGTKVPLDTINNIYCLCPHCHREIHYGQTDVVQRTIYNLVDARPEILSVLDNKINDIYSYYAVEEINS